MLERIIALIQQLGTNTPAAIEAYRLFKMLLGERDQAKLQAAIPDLERLEDETHRQAQLR